MVNQGNILYSIEDCWGINYLFKRGYLRVTDNKTNIPESEIWITRFYYVNESGNVFLNCKEGRKRIIEMNPKINLCSEEIFPTMRKEFEDMGKIGEEFNEVLSELEKKSAERGV